MGQVKTTLITTAGPKSSNQRRRSEERELLRNASRFHMVTENYPQAFSVQYQATFLLRSPALRSGLTVARLFRPDADMHAMGLRQDWREAWRQGTLAAAVERARRLILEDRNEELIAFSKDAARRFPESAELQLMFARGLRRDERSDADVAAQAAKAATIGARDPSIQVQAGYILIDAGDIEAARQCVARAQESADEHFVFAVDLDGLRGRIAAREGEFAEAEDLFRSVVRREPQWPGNWTQLARFLWARGRNQEALTVIAESLSRLRDENDESSGRRKDIESAERLQSEIANETPAEPDG
jgi:tetratricopeptide (TPR) repeat protein